MLPGAHIIVANGFSLNLTNTPIGGLILGIVAHHICDFLPHLDLNILENYKEFTIKQVPKNIKIFLTIELLAGFLFSFIYFINIFKKPFLLFLFISIGAILPDIISILFRPYANKYGFLRRYINFHDKFQFVLKNKTPKKLIYIGIIEIFVIILSILFFNLSNLLI